MQLFLHYILLGENFIVYVKVPLYSLCLNLNEENSSQNGKFKKIVVPVKIFDAYYHKFQFFWLSCKTVKEFETEI